MGEGGRGRGVGEGGRQGKECWERGRAAEEGGQGGWRTEAMGPRLGHLLSGFQDRGQARPAVSPGGAPRPEHLPFQAVIPNGILLTDKI